MSKENQTTTEQNEKPSKWSLVFNRLLEVTGQNDVASALKMFVNSNIFGSSNMTTIQNARVKGINPLPCDFTKEQLGDFLRNPINSEKPLQQVSQGLRFTAYPYFKILKAYADIPTYHNYAYTPYTSKEELKSEDYKREERLIDKFNKALDLQSFAHKVAGEATTNGKVFYILRYSVDKTHNKVNYAFAQQLPQDYCTIIGYNNISKYTISFNMMYFAQMGTDITQFGDLFTPYIADFNRIFTDGNKPNKNYVYASLEDNGINANVGGKNIKIYRNRLNANGVGNPRLFQQNGTWFYYVSLPIDKVWTFEVDDTTPIVASPFSGLQLTYAQESDYEQVQMSLLTNPLIKIFTGEIPYRNEQYATNDDQYRLSPSGAEYFNALFDNLMRSNSTSGTAFYSAPYQNIKSHDFSQASNANEISSTYNSYAMEKAGLTALIPTIDNPHQGADVYSGKLESRFMTAIYGGLERCINYIYSTLNLNYEWQIKFFGSIYADDDIRANANKALLNGDVSAMVILAALDNQSLIDKVSLMESVHASGLLDLLQAPQTAYTANSSTGNTKSGGTPASNQGGASTTEERQEKSETKPQTAE